MSQHTFRKWKPRVWQAVNTGLYTVDEEEEDEASQGINQPIILGQRQHHSSSEYSVRFLQSIIHTVISGRLPAQQITRSGLFLS